MVARIWGKLLTNARNSENVTQFDGLDYFCHGPPLWCTRAAIGDQKMYTSTCGGTEDYEFSQGTNTGQCQGNYEYDAFRGPNCQKSTAQAALLSNSIDSGPTSKNGFKNVR